MKIRLTGLLLILLMSLQINAQYDTYEYGYLAMSADGDVIAVSGRQFQDETARLGWRFPIDFYDTTTGEFLGSFTGSENRIVGLALNPEGTLLTYSNNIGRYAIVDVQLITEIDILDNGGTVERGHPIWGSATNTFANFALATLVIEDADNLQRRIGYTHPNADNIVSFDWSTDGNVIVYSTNYIGSDDGFLVVLDVDPSFELTFSKQIDFPRVTTMAINGDGSYIAASAYGDGVLVMNLIDETSFLLPDILEDDAVFSLDWNYAGDRIAVGGRDKITIWDVETRQVIETIATDGRVNSLEWSPDDQFIYHTAGSASVYRNGVPFEAVFDDDK